MWTVQRKAVLMMVALGALMLLLSLGARAVLLDGTLDLTARQTAARRALDHARDAQVHFKTQVQEWKNVLIRGHRPEDFARYWQGFEREEDLVRSELEAVRSSLSDAPSVHDQVESFIEEHRRLGRAYRDAAALREAGGPDAHIVADREVRGIDRPPTEHLEALVAEVDEHTQALVTAAESRMTRQSRIAFSGQIAFIVIMLAWISLRFEGWVSTRVRTAVRIAEEVASGRLDGAAPEIPGNDDVARLVRSLEQMRRSLANARDQESQTRRELERTALLMAEARDQALAGTRAKMRFLATMSHELRTPLNAIIGYSELLFEEVTDTGSAGVDDIRAIRSAGRHLLGLVDDVLDLSRLESDRMQLDIARVSLRPLLEEVLCTVRPVDPGFELRLVIEPGSTALHTDAHALSRVLVNLAANAVKFTEEGEVVVSVTRAAQGIRFEVSDTGIGMDEETLSRVFDAFAQGDGSTRRRFGGTGLGLTICKRLVEQLGGEIEVESAVGRGSTFRFTLPDRAEAARADAAVSPLAG